MVKLSMQQENHIVNLQRLKENYDTNLERLQAEFEAAKEDLKNPIRKAVVEAQDAGVPVRQIHQRGLGWQQVASMVNFLETKPETLGQRLKRLTQPVTANVVDNSLTSKNGSNTGVSVSYESKTTLKMHEFKKGYFRVTDRVGDDWEFQILGTDMGMPIMVEGHEAFTISDDGPEIRQLFLDKFPNIARMDLDDK